MLNSREDLRMRMLLGNLLPISFLVFACVYSEAKEAAPSILEPLGWDAAGCNYSFEKEIYISVGDDAIVRIGGKEITLVLKRTNEDLKLSTPYYKEFENGDVTLRMDVKPHKNKGDEKVSYEDATVKVRKGKAEQTILMNGECGC
jgi:hypothetical protein